MHRSIKDVEQYSEDQFVIKPIFKGIQSEGVALFLLPGQEMPQHPHERFEVTMMSVYGRGVATINGAKEMALEPGAVFYEPAGATYAFRNSGTEPLAVLITLVRVEPDTDEAEDRDYAGSGQLPLPAS